MALGFIPTKAPTQPKLRGAKIGPFKYGWVCAPEGAAHPLILDGLCLHVLSSFQRTEPCIALPCFRSATFQIYDSSYIAVNPKNRPVARFFTPLSSPKPVKRRRIRHRGSSRLQDRSGSGRPGTCCAGPEATSTCHVDRRDSLRTSKNITRSRPCQILHRFEARQRPRTSKTPANPDSVSSRVAPLDHPAGTLVHSRNRLLARRRPVFLEPGEQIQLLQQLMRRPAPAVELLRHPHH